MNQEQDAFRINVVVAATSPDVKAEVIAEAVDARPDMRLVLHWKSPMSTSALVAATSAREFCALIVVGPSAATDLLAAQCRTRCIDLVVLHVDVEKGPVRIALANPHLDSLLNALRDLVEYRGTRSARPVRAISGDEVPHIRYGLVDLSPPIPTATDDGRCQALLQAALGWVHEVLRAAIQGVPNDDSDARGWSVTGDALLRLLSAPADGAPQPMPQALASADAALRCALASADAKHEPLAMAHRTFGLADLDFRMLTLALAADIDPRYQRCLGFLLDDAGRRVGTMSLYSALLGAPAPVRNALATGALERWRVFDNPGASDEPLRIDPFLARWLVGEGAALGDDPHVRRVLRLRPWTGASLLRHEYGRAASVVEALQGATGAPWVVLSGDDPAGWRALFELGAEGCHVRPIRVEAALLAGLDALAINECGRRVGRLTRLTGRPLALDLTQREADGDADGVALFLAAVASTRCTAALIGRNRARLVRVLGPVPFRIWDEPALSLESRVAAVRAAATDAEAYLTEESAAAIASRYPLDVEGLDHAARLAGSGPLSYDRDDPRLARFTAACKHVAAEGVSGLAERIEPVVDLDDVVLPPDRKQQLREIIDNVRLAPRVLDEWKFREQLPYGRGVTALFFGPSGTGKTMAALGVARFLGVQLLRFDLSKMVSKYIGDTEKNIDRVFGDAQRSGSAILIDEADALLGKRSEVKDAHDRYANIEVAYLLQRMEAFEGLAILTTNLRQNLDPAFLRRLRFLVDFPRPDLEAREKIWRLCLPAVSHTLDMAAFRQLARRIDLTGGHIRQITVRAAFLAAAAGTLIGLTEIAQATRAELAKLGMAPIELDVSDKRKAA